MLLGKGDGTFLAPLLTRSGGAAFGELKGYGENGKLHLLPSVFCDLSVPRDAKVTASLLRPPFRLWGSVTSRPSQGKNCA